MIDTETPIDDWSSVFVTPPPTPLPASAEFEIITNNPSSGDQALLIKPTAAEPDQIGARFRRNQFNLSFIDPSDPNSSKLRIQADIRLDGEDTGEGIGADIISGNLELRFLDPINNDSSFPATVADLATMLLSSNGNVYASIPGQSYQFETPITLGQYHTLAIEADFNTRTSEFFVNNQSIGQLPFPSSVNFDNTNQFISHNLVALDLPFLGLPAPSDYSASDYALYFDNASISSNAIIPEPSTLLGSFLIGGLFWRKKKTKLG